MPDADAGSLFKRLPEVTAEAAWAAAHAARAWLRDSARASAGGPPERAGLLLLARAELKLRIQIARQGHEVVFFFFEKDLPVERPAEAEVTLALRPEPEGAEEDAAAAPPAPGAASYRLAAPWFAVRAADGDLRPYTPAGVTWDQCVFFRLDPEGARVLGVRTAPAGKRRIRWTNGAASVEHAAENGQWAVGPFLALAAALARWQASGGAREGALALPPAAGRNDAHVVLDFAVAACSSAAARLRAERAVLSGAAPPERCPCGHLRDDCPYTNTLPPELEGLLPACELGAFEADFTLRLNGEGRLSGAGEEATAISFGLAVEPASPGLSAHVTLRPPDLVKQGPWREAFLDGAAASADLADAFDPGDHGAWDRFFEGARARAVVLGCSLDGEDEECVLALASAGRTVLASATAKSAPGQAPPVKLSGAALFHDSARPGSGKLPEEAAGLFFSFFSRFRAWVSLL